jgi:hypothetical protein
VITATGFPYYNLTLKKPPDGVNLHLRFFDFTKKESKSTENLNRTSLFELNAGLVSALFEYARNINKKIENLEFKSKSEKNGQDHNNSNVLITAQTESYLLQKSVKAKIKLIYDLIIKTKIPLDSGMEIFKKEEKKISDILNDKDARKRIKKFENKVQNVSSDYLKDMKAYGLNGICITSFDLSPLVVFGKDYSLEDVDIILRNIGGFPEISPLEWIYRQSYLSSEQIWVYIIKSGVGPTVEGLFEPYIYLLFADPQSYLGEFPGKLVARFDQILG